MATLDSLHDLASAAACGPTVSLFLGTDPRDPANTAQTPAWLVAARNGLRDVTDALEAGDDRDARRIGCAWCWPVVRWPWGRRFGWSRCERG